MFTDALLIIALVPVAAAFANQTKTPLSVSGQVLRVTIVEEDADSLLLRTELDLTIKNDSQNRVILYWHDFEVVGLRLLRIDDRKREVLYSTSSLGSVDRSPRWSKLQKQLNTARPPTELTRTIEAGESFNLQTSSKSRIYKKANIYWSSWAEIRQASPLWLTVELEMFPGNLNNRFNSKTPFGKHLRQRWSRFGNLQLEIIESEPISLDLTNLVSHSNR